MSSSGLNSIYDQILPYHLVKFCLDSYRSKYNNDFDPFLSPLYMSENVLINLPPVRILVGSSDPLRDDCFLFLNKLIQLNVDVQLIEMKFFPHGFLNYDYPFMMPEASVASDIVIEQMSPFK